MDNAPPATQLRGARSAVGPAEARNKGLCCTVSAKRSLGSSVVVRGALLFGGGRTAGGAWAEGCGNGACEAADGGGLCCRATAHVKARQPCFRVGVVAASREQRAWKARRVASRRSEFKKVVDVYPVYLCGNKSSSTEETKKLKMRGEQPTEYRVVGVEFKRRLLGRQPRFRW